MRAIKKGAAVYVLLFLVSCAFFWEAAFFRKAFFYFDIVGFNLPLRQYLGEQLREGIFPLWCPERFCGFPVFAEGQGGFLYPPNLLLFPFMAAWKAFNISMILNCFLGSCFMYAYLRRKFPALAAILGGVTFAYGGYFLCHSIHTAQVNVAIWLPLLFLFADKSLEGGGLRSIAAAACVLAVMIFAGHAHACMICLAGLAFYLFYRGIFSGRPGSLIACLLVLSLVVIAGVGLGAVQLLPMAELTEHSGRFARLPYGFLVRGSFSPAFFGTLLVPDLFGSRGSDTVWFGGAFPYHEMDVYMGILPLVLLIVAVTQVRERRMLPWFALWVTSVALMLGKYTIFYRVFAYIPYFDRMRLPSKYALLFSFSSSVLIAFGAEFLFTGRKIRLRPPAIGVVLAALLAAAVYCVTYDGTFRELQSMDPSRLSQGWLERLERLNSLITLDAEKAVAFLAITFSIILFFKYKSGVGNLLAAFSVAVVLVDLFNFSGSRVALIDPSLFTEVPPTVASLREEEGLFRIYSDDIFEGFSYAAPGWMNDSGQYFYSLYSLPYDTHMLFNVSSIRGGSPLALRRMDRAVSGYRRGIIDMLNGRYILMWRKLSGGGLELIYDRGPFIYRNSRALERACVVPAAVFARSGEEAFSAVTTEGFNPRRAVVIEGADPLDFRLSGAESLGERAETRISSYSGREVVVEADMPYNGFLVLSDAYYPGWHAEDNGEETRIYRANYMVRAVYLKEGRHRVRFYYRPGTFRLGLMISASFLIAVLLLLAAGGKRAPRFFTLPEGEGEMKQGAKLVILAVLLILIALSLVIEPGHWRDAFMTLRVR